MREALERLSRRLARAPHPYVAATVSFLELDLRRMKEDLRLAKRGAENGAKCMPAPDSERYDDAEQEIAQEIEAERKRCTDSYLDNMRTYAERRRSLDIEGRVSEIDAAAREAIADFRVQVKKDLDDLHNLKADVTEVEDEFKEFKQAHRLRRTAHYPQARVLHYGLLAVIFGIEALLNATFIAEGHELGYIGGIGLAAGIAALNIGGSYLLGRNGFPNLVHRSFFRKLSGLLILSAYVPALFTFNLFVGHFREAFGARLTPESVVRVVETFWLDPLSLGDFQSWLLVGLGCLFAVIAAGDGLASDDLYPGYGRVDRKRKRVNTRYADQKAALIDELTETKTRAAEAMRIARDDVGKRQKEFYAVLEAQDRLRNTFKVHLDYLESVANDLLSAYREANRHARECPSPSRFDEAYKLVRPELTDNSEDASATRVAVEEAVSRATTVLDRRLEEVFSEYEAAVSKYRAIGQLIGKEPEDGARPSPA